MERLEPTIKPGRLTPFFPFTELPQEYVIIAANFASNIVVDDGTVVLAFNSEDRNDYFLLDGTLVSEDVYGTKTLIQSGTEAAVQPLSRDRPCIEEICAQDKARVIKIPQEVIKRVCAEAPEPISASEQEAALDITQTREFYNDFKEELRLNRVRLPSLKNSAVRVHRLPPGAKPDVSELTAAISSDPAIAAKLLKMANCSLFNLDPPTRTIAGIVDQLGIFAAREIAGCFAFRDVFKDAPQPLVSRLRELVNNARQVSVMATAIAEMSGRADPQYAAMAGLLHNVGVFPIFGYSMQNLAYAMNPKLVDRAIDKIAVKTGVLLAQKWRFGEDIVRSIERCTDWSYRGADEPDVVNTVATAKYHSLLSQHGPRGLPKPQDVPAIAAATCGKFNQDFSLNVFGRAKELMNAASAPVSTALPQNLSAIKTSN